MKISDFSIKLERESILNAMDCFEDSPLYEEIVEEFEDMKKQVYEKINPFALLEFSEITKDIATKTIPTGTKALYVITTLGPLISEWSTELFGKGDYLAGIIADGMADNYLFQMDEVLKNIIISECKIRNLGIFERLEAPLNIAMEAQRVAWDITKAKDLLGIEIKESFMFDPVKTMCHIYLLEEGLEEYKIDHNCRKCNAVNCKMRNILPVNITVKSKESTYIVQCKENQSIMEAIQENRTYINAVCGGRGTCGKCKVRILEGEMLPSQEDIRFFSSEELEKGIRLSCKAFPHEDLVISLEFGEEEDFYVISEYEKTNEKDNVLQEGTYVIGIDIGTTTIAMQLFDLNLQLVIDTYTTINKQRSYGADVISRMQASNGGKLTQLKESIQMDLKNGLEYLIQSSKAKVSRIMIAGNTTMIHLLMGYSCESLGVFPFTSVNSDTIQTTYSQLIEEGSLEIPITIMPGISTYVGGDITSGLLACDFHKNEKVNVIIDLGTNGEMAIGNKDRILVTSTAAGPAFEGGNITWGMGSIQGAICNVSIHNKKVDIKTIGDKLPIGICGTGVIEITYELLHGEFIDETGLLVEEYFEKGYLLATAEDGKQIIFTQKDIREIQLAKAAVRAGLEILLLRYGTSKDEIDTVYLAGGFGYKIDIDKAIGIGLLPEEFRGKIKSVGNSSLRGTLEYMKQIQSEENVAQIIKNATEINLSNDEGFNDLYMEHMYFE